LDTGILATPLNDSAIKEHVLFYEKYYLYVNDKVENSKESSKIISSYLVEYHTIMMVVV